MKREMQKHEKRNAEACKEKCRSMKREMWKHEKRKCRSMKRENAEA
ncbi:MAG: hypothetical protein UHO69_05190 [Prevotella sp.]|nr:hypothetical protein [Prevotella sp.]